MEHLQEFRSQQGEVHCQEEVPVPVGGVEGGQDPAERSSRGNSVEEFASPDNPHRLGDRRKQEDDMFDQRNGAPWQHGFVPAHPSAFAPGQDEPVR